MALEEGQDEASTLAHTKKILILTLASRFFFGFSFLRLTFIILDLIRLLVLSHLFLLLKKYPGMLFAVQS